ncbi:MAG: efflux RND transporter periplasmic adaptor subunit [Candidatus Binatus sp.]
MEAESTGSAKESRGRRRFVVASAIAVVLVCATSAGIVLAYQMRLQSQAEQIGAQADRGPRVLVEAIHSSESAREYEIPITVRGYVETPVYAKIPGYLKTIYVDKGDRVKKGQVIAILESPETDKEVADALANYKLQQITYKRYQYLLEEQVVPQQTADNWHASMLQAQAFYQQNLAMQGYEVVRAPVDGIITARYFDLGAMIPAATTPVSATSGPGFPTNTTSSPIVSMATVQPLRIYAYAPQPLTPLIHDGDHASVTVAEYPGQEFEGTVTRHPDALDEGSRTMLVEVDLPNRDLKLMPGMYGDVRLTTAPTTGGLVAPDDALVFKDDKIYLPIVRDNRLHLAEVQLGHDNGVDVVVSGDVRDGDLVAMSVGQAVDDGEPVQPVMQNPGKS